MRGVAGAVFRKTRPVKIPAQVPHTGASQLSVASSRPGVRRTDTKMEHRHAADTNLELRHQIRIPTPPVGSRGSCQRAGPLTCGATSSSQCRRLTNLSKSSDLRASTGELQTCALR